MEFLFEKYQQKLRYTSLSYIRSMMDDIDWNVFCKKRSISIS